MTTYTLRKGSPDKTGADVVVVGVVQAGKGVRRRAGGEDVAVGLRPQVRAAAATLGFTGKPGEVAKVPTAGTIKSPLLILVGLGTADEVDPEAVRRAAGVAARTVTNAASVALALPGRTTPRMVRAVIEGSLLGGYSFTRYKTAPDSTTAPGRGRRAQRHRPHQGRPGRARDRPGRRRAPSPVPATGSTPLPATSPPRPSPTTVVAHDQGPQGRRKVDGQGVRRRGSSRPTAAAASSASGRARPTRRGWCG